MTLRGGNNNSLEKIYDSFQTNKPNFQYLERTGIVDTTNLKPVNLGCEGSNPSAPVKGEKKLLQLFDKRGINNSNPIRNWNWKFNYNICSNCYCRASLQ